MGNQNLGQDYENSNEFISYNIAMVRLNERGVLGAIGKFAKDGKADGDINRGVKRKFN